MSAALIESSERPEPRTILSRLKGLQNMAHSMQGSMERCETSLFEIDPQSITPANAKGFLSLWLEQIGIFRHFIDGQVEIVDEVIERIEADES